LKAKGIDTMLDEARVNGEEKDAEHMKRKCERPTGFGHMDLAPLMAPGLPFKNANHVQSPSPSIRR
jgi:hypothetical protein